MCSNYAQPPFLTEQFGVGERGPGGAFFYGANIGDSLSNLVGKPFAVNGLNETPFAAGQFAGGASCKVGAKNIDMDCKCAGTRDSAPWQRQAPALVHANFNEAIANYGGPANVPNCVGRYLTTVHGMYGPMNSGPSQWTHY